MSTCRRFSLVLILVFMTVACDSDQLQSMSAVQLSRMDKTSANHGRHFSQMVDNAVLSDPSVADIHFIANSEEISGIGEVRLARLSPVLNTYGGTVHYATVLADTALVAKRLDRVREYLTLSGCNMERVDVVVGRQLGRGMLADEAVFQYKEGPASTGGKSLRAGSDDMSKPTSGKGANAGSSINQ